MPSMNVVFERIYVRERLRLKRLASSILGNAQDADDILHETYVKLSKRSLTENDGGLVVHTVTTLALDHIRSRKTRPDRLNYGDTYQVQNDTTDYIQPERIVEARHELSDLLNAINALPKRRGQIFLLARVDGMTYQQIARHLKISLSTVEKEMAAAISSCHKWQQMREEK
ncbi:hypothetical protein ACI0FR_02539 [Paenochrobactrum sp. BZR 201-1]